MANIFITGGTGALGRELIPQLLARGHAVTVLVRCAETASQVAPGATVVLGNPLIPGPWWDGVARADTAINLAGEPIMARWTSEKKRRITISRHLTTENLVSAMPSDKTFTLFSASAVGYYGDCGEAACYESSQAGSGFLPALAFGWEERAKKAVQTGRRVVLLRFGVMLGPGPGPLHEMLKSSTRFGGGMAGRGNQYLSWIARSDAAAAIHFLLDRKDIEGPVNLSSPNPVTHRQANDIVARLTGRTPLISVPALAVRLALGEFADAILTGQRMIPQKLLDAGFTWKYPLFEEAVREALGAPG